MTRRTTISDKYVLSPFEECLQSALKMLNDPERLGEQSPLATPYFLSHALTAEMNQSAAHRRLGETLCIQIRQAAADLWGEPLPTSYDLMRRALKEERKTKETHRYSYLVLELRYFRQFFHPSSLREIYENPDYLLDSKAGDYRSHRIAIKHLGEQLLGRLQPTLRLEQPGSAHDLIGYDAHFENCLKQLQERITLSISGASGTGKTALAARIASTRPPNSVFWYTIRPTFNDHLGSLLFTFGYYLHTVGVSNLWRLLLSTGGEVVEPEVAFAMVRQDIEELGECRPLICIDEVDQLDSTDLDPAAEPHRQMLEFIQALRGVTALLLIGQRAVIESDSNILLTGLAVPQIQLLMRRSGITLSDEFAERLYHYTHGNPRLLHLCIALHEQENSIEKILAGLSPTPGLHPILKRLWGYLTHNEKRLLQQLSVFRSPIPTDGWHQARSTIQRLRHLRLLNDVGQGAIELVPALRSDIYHYLTQEQKEDFHLEAAVVRQERAEYTAAAYHYWQANHPAEALYVWFPHRQLEIRRGQANAASGIFHQLSVKDLSDQERQAIALIRAELHRLSGMVSEGLAEISKTETPQNNEVSILLKTLRGEFEEALGYTEKSLRTFMEGRTATLNLLEQLSSLHYRRGTLFLTQRELKNGWQEANAIEYTWRTLCGRLHEEEGRYHDAQKSYQQALTLANSTTDNQTIALAYRNLADIHGRQQNHDAAIQYAKQAMQCYDQMEDRWNMERLRSDMAFICIQTGHFEEAIAYAMQAYHFFEAAKISPYTAITAGNLADAYVEVGDLDKAQFYAEKTLEQEEQMTHPYAYFNLGRIAFAQLDYANAEANLIESVRGASQNEDTYLEAYAERELGKVYLAQMKLEQGRVAIQKALGLFERMEMQPEVEATYRLLKEKCNESVT